MTLNQQLHNSATHKAGIDPACPVCNKRIPEIIKDLKRCALQNEKDGIDSVQAKAVAAEQRRMIRILTSLEVAS
jgi:hypothetical protein